MFLLSLIGGLTPGEVRGQTETKHPEKKKSLKADLSSALGCRKLIGSLLKRGRGKCQEPNAGHLSEREGRAEPNITGAASRWQPVSDWPPERDL